VDGIAAEVTPSPGDYFVVETAGVVAKGIRFAQKHWLGVPVEGQWANHCGIYRGDGQIIEANVQRRGLRFRGEVQVTEWAKYENLHHAWSHEPLTHDERELIVGAAEGMVGVPYSFLDIGAMLLELFPGLLGEAARERLNRGDRLICSQVVARGYRVARRILVRRKADNFVLPGELAARLAPPIVSRGKP
jgi:hypothetical protein